MTKRKASLGLGALEQTKETQEEPKEQPLLSSEKDSDELKSRKPVKKKKQAVPLYIDQSLHDALHTLVFSERHKKTTFQTLFIEGLDLLLKQRGLPSVAELSSGEKTLNI